MIINYYFKRFTAGTIVMFLTAWITSMLIAGTFNALSAEEPKVIMNGQYVELHPQADAIDIEEAPPINRISEALDEVDANGHRLEFLANCTITYYCSCRKCNGKWGAIDGRGNPLVWGTVAVDPKKIQLGTKLVIDGYDTVFTARDTGYGVNGWHVDVYVPVSHSEALRMGQGEKRKVWRYQ